MEFYPVNYLNALGFWFGVKEYSVADILNLKPILIKADRLISCVHLSQGKYQFGLRP
jgi:hypothetical protein